MPTANDLQTATPAPNAREALHSEVLSRGPRDAAKLLEQEPDETVAEVLLAVNPSVAVNVLWRFPERRRQQILSDTPLEIREQWVRNHEYPEGSIGRLMDPPYAVFPPELTVAETVERLATLVKRVFVTYGFVTDAAGKLLGVLVFRELLFARPEQPLREIMLQDPFSLRPELTIADAMREVVTRHYPVYPICDDTGHLVGVIRGQTLFAQQAFEISAQAGAMVGVEKEERLSSPWWRSLRFRHPWLQLNLLTAFLAAAVVGAFQETIDRIVLLAVFLPVLAGQSGNTGCQALAVTLRGMTLGELKEGATGKLLAKEAWLGFLNGALVGVSAALGMLVVAMRQGNPDAWSLTFVVLVAMTGSCMASGLSGAVIPMTLKRLGADPATASSIFVTTCTDVASMGLFLSLATMLVG